MALRLLWSRLGWTMFFNMLTVSLIFAAWIYQAGSLQANVIPQPLQAQDAKPRAAGRAKAAKLTLVAKSALTASSESTARLADPDTPEVMSREYLAAICQSSSASLGFSTASSSTPIPDCVIGTNELVYGVAKFSATAVNAVQGHFKLPAGFNTLSVEVETRTPADPGNVVWQLQNICVGQDEPTTLDWGAPDSVTMTSPGIPAQLATGRIEPVNTPGCAAGKRFFFRFFRDPSHPSDDFESAAELVSLRFVVR
ncbi:hypothetical protein [Paludibaculum fermentans]|uniref:Uncharacterized protein n=1 Tax=Paludibaculum fermentans TaxID=1473598 RepID=A0A7S7NYU8_PALFE|nr:hypothetical protein [Paludibaculum fermentans]QOY92308.1 hypothetical protein IRI77_37820 [Paludibaculum fermentans]